MPGRALSETKKKQNRAAVKAAALAYATDRYLEEQEKKARGETWIGAKNIRDEVIALWKVEKKQEVKFTHQTILNHAAGRPTRADANAKRSLLTPEEVEVVITYIIEVGRQGFPLSHRRLKEHVDEILCARLGQDFEGVGRRWTNRFIEKHSARIRMEWAKPLEEKRGRAVNPHTKAAWDELLLDTVTKYEIEADTMLAMDEIGVAGYSGQKERVMGGKGKGPAYQQTGGGRQNTTVLVTICADGTAEVPPAVIMQGAAYCTSWMADNPAKAS